MYRRLFAITFVIFAGLCGLCVLGLHSIDIMAEGLAGKRFAEFMDVAEQIRTDIKRKLDAFIAIEQNRPYTDYQYLYVPQTSNDADVLLRSPLADGLRHGFAYGHFQVEPDGTVITPYYISAPPGGEQPEITAHIDNIRKNLLAVLNGAAPAGASIEVKRISKSPVGMDYRAGRGMDVSRYREPADKETADSLLSESSQGRAGKSLSKTVAKQQQSSQGESSYLNTNTYSIPSLQEQQKTQVLSQSRDMVERNIDNRARQAVPVNQSRQQNTQAPLRRQQPEPEKDTVQIRIEPLVPVVLPAATANGGLFEGQVFLIRHLQIEDRHFLQGFKLDQTELAAQVKESAERLCRRGMGFELAGQENRQAAHTAILDFGFGSIVLNLFELEPGWITRQINSLRNWYFTIISVVFAAVMLSVIGLWRTAKAQMKLIRKKDDFLSAVSHELRTPLTTIRMYTEMLEKDWLKTPDKRLEYYATMRQETERLTRLIENVLDFSRIQRGRKKYFFKAGNINDCISGVIEMMLPVAGRAGFTIKKNFTDLPNVAFDSDAVMQIVINLIDNAIKYAAGAADKTITVSTTGQADYVIIEVQDYGPGIPRANRKRIFDEFYRCGNESVRETTGTGLGLALVKKFAHAHNGFVEVLSAKPCGSIFRIGLAVLK